MKNLISPSFARRMRFVPLTIALVLLLSGVVTSAADPDFVGVLAIAVDDATAQQLGLSDEVRDQLRKLVADREKAAVSIALSIKELPPEEQARRLAPFVEESERLGMKLLSLEQRSRLDQLRLQQGGMTTLAEPNMVQLLQLTGEQKAEIQRLLGERAVAETRGGETDRRRARDSYERLLRAVLSSSQKATWDQMAGLGPGPAAQKDIGDSTAKDPGAVDEGVSEEGAAGAEMAADPNQAETSGDSDVAADATTEPDQGSTEDPDAAPSPSDTQPAIQPPGEQPVDAADVKLRFNFRFQPWGDVLDWLSEQADLSLQSSILPEGTFNYSDTAEYTPTEAIDLINGVLLYQGYTLVRRGRLLTVIDLEDEVPDVLVEFVPVEKLDERGEFELVKTVFHMARMEPADVEQEIGQLLGPGRSMVVMPKARQIMVTETAGKLRMIRDVIERAENPSGQTDGLVEIELTFITPEELLGSARGLLGLGEGEDVGDDIAVAQDSSGTRLFANGSREKIDILKSLAESLDQERVDATNALALEQPQLRTHPILTADPLEALSVLQTLLAGLPDVRMSLDEKTTKVIALAPPSVHKTIEETIKQLEGLAPRIEVIQLRRIDPQMAVVAIGNFFSGDAEGESTIKIDADPLSMRLYIRATEAEIAEIKLLIDKLEGPMEGSEGGTLRFIPTDTQAAEDAVETAQRLWLEPNKIHLLTPSESRGGPSLFDLKEVNPVPPAEQPKQPVLPRTMPSTSLEKTPVKAVPPRQDKVTFRRNMGRSPRVPVQFVSFHNDEESSETEAEVPDEPQEVVPEKPDLSAVRGADIRIEVTPNGIILASEDTEALDKFETLLRQVLPVGGLGPAGKGYTVYFLKYCKADVARQLISDILGGSTSDVGGGSLIGDVASNLMGGGGGILGALLGGGGGGGGSAVTTVQGTGTVSIVADARLNCLVVQGMPVDLKLVEQLLKVIDREGSITDIQTSGTPHVIPIVYMNAEDVANVVKEAFADRMAQAAGGQRGGQPNPAELIRALRGGRGGGGAAEVKSEMPKMTIAVDVASNSLVVTAPEQLYLQVRDLVMQIDQANSDMTEEVVAVSIKNSNPEAVQKALASIMGQSSSRSSSSRPGSSTSGRPTFGGGSSTGDIQARIDAFRRMRESGMFGGGGRPGGTSGFGSRPGGTTSGRPSPFGGRGGSTGGRGGGPTGGPTGGRGGGGRGR